MYAINGSISWKHDEYVVLNLFEDYSISEAAFECELNSSLTSTLKNIPTLSAYINHNQNNSKVDTILKLMVLNYSLVLIHSCLTSISFCARSKRSFASASCDLLSQQ